MFGVLSRSSGFAQIPHRSIGALHDPGPGQWFEKGQRGRGVKNLGDSPHSSHFHVILSADDSELEAIVNF